MPLQEASFTVCSSPFWHRRFWVCSRRCQSRRTISAMSFMLITFQYSPWLALRTWLPALFLTAAVAGVVEDHPSQQVIIGPWTLWLGVDVGQVVIWTDVRNPDNTHSHSLSCPVEGHELVLLLESAGWKLHIPAHGLAVTDNNVSCWTTNAASISRGIGFPLNLLVNSAGICQR